jgi:uncharacterized protein (TIRG00374 family)
LKSLKSIVFTILKIGGTGYLFYYLAYKINWFQLKQSLLSAHFLYLFGAVVLYFLKLCIEAYKWQVLNKIYGVKIEYGLLLRFKIIGPAFDYITPLPQGEDVFKFYVLKKNGSNNTISLLIPVLFKLTGLAATLLLLPAGLIYYMVKWDNSIISNWLYPAAIILVSIVLFIKYKNPICQWIEQKAIHKPQSLINWIIKTLKSINVQRKLLQQNFVKLIKAVVLSWLSLVLYAAVCWLLIKSLDQNIPFMIVVISMPFIFFAATMPLVIGGIGLKEGALISIMLYHHISEIQAQSVGAIHLCLMAFFAIIGMCIFWWSNDILIKKPNDIVR